MSGPVDRNAELLQAYAAGDSEAFDELVRRNQDRVFALLYRFLGPRSNIEDLAQDVFLRVLKAAPRYEPRAKFTTWLYRIVFNVAVNETQRGSKRRMPSLDAPDMPMAVDLRVDGPVADLEGDERKALLHEAIGRLPENQRAAILLAAIDGLSLKEVAEVIDSTEKAVKSLLHRARRALRAELEPLLGVEDASEPDPHE